MTAFDDQNSVHTLLKQIAAAAEAVRNLRPAYTDILSFYEPLFLVQEAAKPQLFVEPLPIPENILLFKQRGALPLIDPEEFSIDFEKSPDIFRQVCRVASGSAQAMQAAGAELGKRFDAGALYPERLFKGFFKTDEAAFAELAQELNLDPELLVFLTYSSLFPSISLCAEKLSGHLAEDEPWEKGYCPICGNLPGLSMLKGDGERSFACSFCGHEYPGKRIFCPFCETTDSSRLQYLFSDAEPEYRVHLCDACKRYVKTVDCREISRPFYAPLEQICTLHLDMVAQEREYRGGGRFFSPAG